MQNSLTSLFTAIPVQPTLERPAARAAARDREVPASPGPHKDRQNEFQLPPEPRERARGPERSRGRPDEPRSPSETRRPDSARETAPRREDPPRGTEQARDGEPPRRLDPPGGPTRRAESEPPRRTDEAGSAQAVEASSDDTGAVPELAAGETAPEAKSEAAVVAGEVANGGIVFPETLLNLDTLPSPVAAGTAVMPEQEAVDIPETGSGALQPANETSAVLDGTAPEPAVQGAEATAEEVAVSSDTAVDQPAGEADEVLADGSDGAEGAEGEVLPTANAALDGPAQGAHPAEQASPVAAAAVAMALPAAASSVAQQNAAPGGQTAPSEAVEGIAGKPTGPQDKRLALHERAEQPRDQSTRTDTAKGAQATASDGDAKPLVKAEQPLPTAFEVPSAGSQPAQATSPNMPAAQAPGIPNTPIRVVAEVPLGAVPVEIGLKSLAGVNHFEIRLDPAELGRIEVRLDIDQDGGVKAHLTVDRVETLALLQRDSRSLERAFEQAGLKPTDGSVDLTLRDQPSNGQGRQEHGGEGRREAAARTPDGLRENVDPLPEAPLRRLWRGAAGVDVRI